ncbi:MAG: cupin domain-containing protein [Candidatus Korarchaeum sp.]|jgi:quercetin dioxygenase-like cupin family protein|nr:cupin domain-containing protein [Candidatus Korarchaeum sp.]
MRRIPVLESGDMRVESEGEDIPEHTHEADEVVYVERGSAEITVEGKAFHVG